MIRVDSEINVLNPERYDRYGTVTISEDFWADAKACFMGKDTAGYLEVIDEKKEIKGLAYNDSRVFNGVEESLDALENGCFFMPEEYKGKRFIALGELNEYTWRFYKIFTKNGYRVFGMEKEWEWFGAEYNDTYQDEHNTAVLYFHNGNGFNKKYGGGLCQAVDFYTCVRNIAEENMKAVYLSEMGKLVSKGADVCECYVPDSVEATYCTEDEKASIRSNLILSQYLLETVKYTDDMERCVWNIYGKDKVLAQKDGLGMDYKRIPLGEIFGRSIGSSESKKRIYLIGSCIAAGLGCLEIDSLCGQLQKKVDMFGYQVVSIAVSLRHFDIWQVFISKMPIQSKDIILVVNIDSWFPVNKKLNVERIDLESVYKKEKRGTLFCGVPIHTNPEGNRLIAGEIFDNYLQRKINQKIGSDDDSYLQEGEILNKEAKLDVQKYIDSIKKDCSGKTGAIVMNCNPFTYGHKYLIGYAADKVDLLYVFVVEEDKSYFKFEDRLEMVQKGTEEFSNVVVIPSGKWVLSYQTLPAYFEKEGLHEVEIDARQDLEIFSRYIAPGLGVSRRFVGQEPFDKVTAQYNARMKEILKSFGIEVEEIPRLEIGGEIVSASSVRKHMQEREVELLRKYVPESTYSMCMEYMERNQKGKCR